MYRYPSIANFVAADMFPVDPRLHIYRISTGKADRSVCHQEVSCLRDQDPNQQDCEREDLPLHMAWQ